MNILKIYVSKTIMNYAMLVRICNEHETKYKTRKNRKTIKICTVLSLMPLLYQNSSSLYYESFLSSEKTFSIKQIFIEKICICKRVDR